MSNINDYVIDQGLNKILEADQLHICTQQPLDYSEVATYSMGFKTSPVLNDPATYDGTRGVMLSSFSDGVINTSGIPVYFVLVNSGNSEMLSGGNIINQGELSTGAPFGFDDTLITGIKQQTGVTITQDVGVNLGFITYYATDQPFVNRLYNAYEWLVSDAPFGGNWDNSANVQVPLREDGFPTHVPFDAPAETGLPPQMVKVLLFRADTNFPTGDYYVYFEGTGKISLNYSASGDFTESGVLHTVNVAEASPSGLLFMIKESDINDPVRNVKIIMPGYGTKHETQTYTDEFKDLLSVFTTIRYMDWGATNRSPVTTVSDRKKPDYYSQADDYGLAWEHMIQLSNETKKAPWFCIPHKATDTLVREYANVVKDNLDPSLDFYLEYSNEIWNGTFSQYDYCRDQGKSAGLDTNDYYAALKYQSRRSGEIWQIFNEVLGNESSRMIKVIGSKFFSTSTPTNLLAWTHDITINEAGILPDVLAVGAYFGHFLGDQLIENNELDTITMPEFMSRVEQDVADTIPYIDNNLNILAPYPNVKLVAYEGGQHIVGTRSNIANDQLTEFLNEANRQPEMYTFYKDFLNAWFSKGGGMFAAFNLCQSFGSSGSWGMLEYQTQDINTAYKYKAILELEG